MAYLSIGTKIEVQSTIGTAITVSAVTKANPGVATATAHGLANGDVVVWSVSAGMVELDQQAHRVSGVVTDSFTLEGLNTTSYSTFTAGTVKKVTAFQTISTETSGASMADAAPNKIDITPVSETRNRQYAYGLRDAPDGSLSLFANPASGAQALIKAATDAGTPLAIRMTIPGTNIWTRIFNANVSGGSGIDMTVNAAITSTASFTPINKVMDYVA